MSFKRDGDDICALNYQRKQRVAELLYEDIGDGEVNKLSNGKYTCKVCKHRPVFDTLNMFYVHRQGRKHQSSVQYAEQQKQELVDLVQKRKHEQMSHVEHSNSIVREAEGDGGTTVSLGAKRQKMGRFDRRKLVDLDTPDVAIATSLEALPGNRSTVGSGLGYLKNKKLGMSCKMRVDESTGHRLFPKDSCSNQSSQSEIYRNEDERSLLNLQNNEKVIDNKHLQKIVRGLHTDERNKSYLARKRQKLDQLKDISKELSSEKTAEAGGSKDPRQSWQYYKNMKGGHIIPKRSTAGERSSSQFIDGSKVQEASTTHGAGGTSVSSLSAEKAEKMLKAFGSGWKKDWTGKWIRDEDAEFDSDEEPPEV